MGDNTIEAIEVRQSAGVAPINLQAAIDGAAQLGPDGVEVLERLHRILITERDHDAYVAFSEAKARVRGRIKPPAKPSKVQIGKSGAPKWYADLEQLEKAVMDAGAVDDGFSWYWDTEHIGDRGFSVFVLLHVAGHEQRVRFEVELDARDNQALSSVQKRHQATSAADRISFMRGWGLVSLVSSEPPRGEEPVTADEALTLESRCREAAEAEGVEFAHLFKMMLDSVQVGSVAEFPRSKYQAALNTFAKRIKRAEVKR